ncbi:MAG: DUF5050 domain-containing protein [Bacteroidota bacterium]|nr:DUF5050 domain-containing protein [Bacteroidota bacterium]
MLTISFISCQYAYSDNISTQQASSPSIGTDTFTYDGNINPSEKLNNSIVIYIGSPKAYVRNQKVYIDEKDLSKVPFVKNGTTFVPSSFIEKCFEAESVYDPSSRSVNITINGINAEFTVGSKNFIIDGNTHTLNTPVVSVNGEVYIPYKLFVEEIAHLKLLIQNNIIIVDTESALSAIIKTTGLINSMNQLLKLSPRIYFSSVTGMRIGKLDPTGNGRMVFEEDAWSPELIGIDNGWIYYSEDHLYDLGHGKSKLAFYIYKMRIDEKVKQRIFVQENENCHVFGLRNHYIYLLIDTSLYRMKTDGTGKELISYNAGEFISVTFIGDWLYYQANKGNDLCGYNTITGKKMKVISLKTTVDIMGIDGDWFYYETCYDNKHLLLGKTKANGMNNTVLVKGYTYYIDNIIIKDGWVYFRDLSNKRLYKIRTDGTKKTLLKSNVSIMDLMYLKDNSLYYVTFSDGFLHKFDLKTGKTIKLNSLACSVQSSYPTALMDGWLYYSESNGFYKMKEDGSHKTRISNYVLQDFILNME